MKYICFEPIEANSPLFDFPILFPDYLPHDSMTHRFPKHKAVSAGFVSIDNTGTLVAYGESVGLELKARPEDDAILNNAKRRYT